MKEDLKTCDWSFHRSQAEVYAGKTPYVKRMKSLVLEDYYTT